MNEYNKIWELALPYLKKGSRKDFIIHTKGVLKAVKLITKKEGGDAELLIPAAILHDVGWSKVPLSLQKSNKSKDKIEGLKLHIIYSSPIIKKTLSELDFKKERIDKIVNIVLSHKFKKPREKNKKILIDADNLSDAFEAQFASDAKQYSVTRHELYKYRIKDNKFYTKTARELFNNEINKRIKNK